MTQQMIDDECKHEQLRLEWMSTACPGAGFFVCGLFPDIVSDKIYQPDAKNYPLWWKSVQESGSAPWVTVPLAGSMFVNAWDPHSIVGNGNAGDHSLDGFMGRCTEMAALSFPGTNTQIQYKQL